MFETTDSSLTLPEKFYAGHISWWCIIDAKKNENQTLTEYEQANCGKRRLLC